VPMQPPKQSYLSELSLSSAKVGTHS